MLKFQKKTSFGNRNNHISEYIGCHIFEQLGFEAQETFLGTYQGEYVVACKDFNSEDAQFVPFNDVGESSLDQDKETYQYDYEDIVQMLTDNAMISEVEAIEKLGVSKSTFYRRLKKYNEQKNKVIHD